MFGASARSLGFEGDKTCDLFVLYVHLSIPGPEARDPNCGVKDGAAHFDRTRTRPQQWLFAEIQALRDSLGIHKFFFLFLIGFEFACLIYANLFVAVIFV